MKHTPNQQTMIELRRLAREEKDAQPPSGEQPAKVESGEGLSKLITPLSLDQITPEIRLLASRCILASGEEGGAFSKDAHKYAAYTIIRERQLLAKVQEVERLKGLLRKIAEIPNKLDGGDWDEIEEAQSIARSALKSAVTGE